MPTASANGHGEQFAVQADGYALRCITRGTRASIEVRTGGRAVLALELPCSAPPTALLMVGPAMLFLAVGDRAHIYDLQTAKLVRDERLAGHAFAWQLHGDVVLLLADYDCLAFSARGAPLWSVAVEPPWQVDVRGDNVTLDVRGSVQRFALATGPAKT